ncbi:MAG: NUDIX domain-containing protein [Synergistaceae bacterium]
MRIVKQLTSNRFLNIKEVRDHQMGCKGYQFAERKGVDSVAFICIDERNGKFLINNEATPPLGIFLRRAFGGSIDKDKSFEQIVKDEVLEECGYDVADSQIHFVGKAFVSTQMNQYCHLYLVFINDNQETERKPENATEALSHPVWMSEKEIIDGDDWKSIMILQKSKSLKLID